MSLTRRHDWRGYDCTDAGRSGVIGDATTLLDLTPRCLRCGSTTHLVRLPFGSIRHGEHVCAKCLDALLAATRVLSQQAQEPVEFRFGGEVSVKI